MCGATVRVTHYLPPALRGVGDLVGCDSQVRQDLSNPSGVHTTVRSYIGLTASVHIHLAHYITNKETHGRLNTERRSDSNMGILFNVTLEGHRCDQ